jgi:hypothetical protein
MRMIWNTLLVVGAALALTFAVQGCDESDDGEGGGGGGGETATEGGETATEGGETATEGGGASIDCSDPQQNPYAGTCLEDFGGGCFQPSGACSATQSGLNVTLEWDNGAKVETEANLSGSATSTGYGADGTECFTGTSAVDIATGSATTTYTTAEGTYTFSSSADGSVVVTCPNEEKVEIDASEAEAAQACQYGSEAEACTFEGSSGEGGEGGETATGGATVGNCESDDDCPSPTVCCEISGYKVCSGFCP